MVRLFALLALGCSAPFGDLRTPPAEDTGVPDPDDPDLPPVEEGTLQQPFVIPVQGDWADYLDAGDTSLAVSDVLDVYPPHPWDESGPEVVYTFVVQGPAWVDASLDLPAGVDVDLHLLASTDPSSLVDRDHERLDLPIDAGRYYLVVDTFVDDGVELSGPYHLRVRIRPDAEGTVADPIPLSRTALPLPFQFVDTRDTATSPSDQIDDYPPYSSDESGPEVLYELTVDQPVRLSAELILPEPDGVDIDVHILDSLDPPHAVDRNHYNAWAVLDPGSYWISMDTWGGDHNAGEYTLLVQARADELPEEDYFNEYILAAVEWLDPVYGRLGYDAAAFTHDIEYGPYGDIPRSGGARTMCVAAVTEVILTAMQLYAEESGDDSIWEFLPRSSWEGWGSDDIKAHLWVSYTLDTAGAADALRHFGMGENIPFEDLRPGSLFGINRTTGYGHAVVFLGFIDIEGTISDTWHEDVIGFYYYSSQGGYDVGYGGLDYRYAVFSEHGSPPMPYKRDLNVIYSESQGLMNTGMMFHPSQWRSTPYADGRRRAVEDVGWFDAAYFTGVTDDDEL